MFCVLTTWAAPRGNGATNLLGVCRRWGPWSSASINLCSTSTFKVLQHRLAVIVDVDDSDEVKESTDEANSWTDGDAVLQTVEAPGRRLRVGAIDGVRDLLMQARGRR